MTPLHPPGYFARLATLLLRLGAAALLVEAAMALVYGLVLPPFRPGSLAGVGSYSITGALLLLVSGHLGKLLARGLDRDDADRAS